MSDEWVWAFFNIGIMTISFLTILAYKHMYHRELSKTYDNLIETQDKAKEYKDLWLSEKCRCSEWTPANKPPEPNSGNIYDALIGENPHLRIFNISYIQMESDKPYWVSSYKGYPITDSFTHYKLSPNHPKKIIRSKA